MRAISNKNVSPTVSNILIGFFRQLFPTLLQRVIDLSVVSDMVGYSIIATSVELPLYLKNGLHRK